MAKNQAVRQFTPLKIICFVSGTDLCRKIFPLSPAAQKTLHTRELPLNFPPIWAAYLRESAGNIFGNSFLKADVP